MDIADMLDNEKISDMGEMAGMEDIKPYIFSSMSGIAAGKEQVTAQIPQDFAQYIYRRAERLGWKRAKFVGGILEWWEKQGCPPISQGDALFPPLIYRPTRTQSGESQPSEVHEHQEQKHLG